MPLSRFPVHLLCMTLFISCGEMKNESHISIERDDFAAWDTATYELNSRKIRYTIDSMRLRPTRMHADKFVREYYAGKGTFLWITRYGVDEKADTLLRHITTATTDGIPEQIFQTEHIKEGIRRIRQLDFDRQHPVNTIFGQTEYLLTQAYLRYACGQRFGYIRPATLFNTLEKTDTTQHAAYHTLYAIPTESPDTTFIRQALNALKGRQLPPFLQSVQPDNKLYQTLKTAYQTEKDQQRRQKIAANMERSRWQSERPEGKYVWVNLADMTLTAVDEKENRKLHMRICCGSPKNKSPMLNSRIEKVEMNPYWNIPYSIIKKEIAPRHAQDAAYFSRNRYRIIDKTTGEELDPVSVTAGMLLSGNFRIRQDNGEGNSLGRLIFRFPNDFSIFLHDTDNRQAFKRKNRAISHGCIRVEQPLELAIFLLPEHDEKVIDRLRTAIGLPPLYEPVPRQSDTADQPDPAPITGVQRFQPPVPVFIQYYTLYPDTAGQLHESGDPYGYDQLLLKKFNCF